MRNRLLLAVLLVFTCTALAQERESAETPPFKLPAGVTQQLNIPYTHTPTSVQMLDLYRPVKGAAVMPGIVFIHGGGWVNGSKNAFRRQAAFMAEHGYVCISINYRLSGEARWPAALDDSKAAVRWLRVHAKEYSVDPNRIAAAGGSAGGHLVTMLGTTGDDPKFEGKGDNQGVSSKVQAVVAFNPVTDLVNIHQANPIAAGAIPKFMGGSLADMPDAYAAASPVTHVSTSTAPTLILHGDADTTVPYTQSLAMQDALQKAGVRVEFYTGKDGKHGFFNKTPYYEPTTQRMLEFLNSVFGKS